MRNDETILIHETRGDTHLVATKAFFLQQLYESGAHYDRSEDGYTYWVTTIRGRPLTFQLHYGH